MDLCVKLKTNTQDRELGWFVKRVVELGWSAIAWNQTVLAKAGQKCTTRPHTEVLLPLPDVQSALLNRVLVKRNATTSQNLSGSDLPTDPLDLQLSGGKVSVPQFTQYNRITFTVDEVIDASMLTSTNDALKSFDIVAASTNDGKVFAYLCKVAEIDIISLDFTHRIPFPLNKKLVRIFGFCYHCSLYVLMIVVLVGIRWMQQHVVGSRSKSAILLFFTVRHDD
jgi:hypothetical protein